MFFSLANSLILSAAINAQVSSSVRTITTSTSPTTLTSKITSASSSPTTLTADSLNISLDCRNALTALLPSFMDCPAVKNLAPALIGSFNASAVFDEVLKDFSENVKNVCGKISFDENLLFISRKS